MPRANVDITRSSRTPGHRPAADGRGFSDRTILSTICAEDHWRLIIGDQVDEHRAQHRDALTHIGRGQAGDTPAMTAAITAKLEPVGAVLGLFGGHGRNVSRRADLKARHARRVGDLSVCSRHEAPLKKPSRQARSPGNAP